MSADFSAGSIEGTLDLNTSPFLAGLKLAKNEARDFERNRVKAKLELDDKEFNASKDKDRAELDKFGATKASAKADLDNKEFTAKNTKDNLELDKFGHKKATAKVDVDTAGAMAKMSMLNRVLDAGGLGGASVGPGMILGKGAAGIGGIMSIAAAALPVVGSLGGVAAAAVGAGAALGGMAMAGGAAMATLGISVGLFAKVATADMAKVQAAIKAGTNLSGPAGQAETGLKRITSAWDHLQKSTAGPVDTLIAKALNVGASVLPKLQPIITIMARGLDGVVGRLDALVSSPFFNTFLKGFEGVERELANGLGPVIYNVLNGLMHGFLAFRPLISVVSKGVIGLSQDFDRFMTGPGISQFVGFASKNIPHVMALLGSVFTLIGHVVGGLAPIAGPGLAFVQQLVQMLTPTTAAMKEFVGFIASSMPQVAYLIWSALGSIGPLIHGLIPLVKPALSFIDGLVQAIGKLDIGPLAKGFGSVLTVLHPLIGVALSFINTVLKPVSGFITQLARGPLAELAHGLQGALAPAFGSLGTILTELSGPLTKFIGSIANLVNPTGMKLVATLMGILAKVVGSLAGPLSSLAVVLESVIDTALTAMVPILKAVSPLIEWLAKLIGGSLLQVAKALAPVFGTIVHTLFPALQKVIVALIPPIKEVAQAIFPALVKVIKSVIPVIGPLMAILAELITKVVLPIVIPIIKLLAKVLGFLIPILADVISWVAKGLAWFIKFAEGPQQAQKAIKTAWDWIKKETTAFGQYLYLELQQIKQWAINLGQWFLKTFVGFFRDGWTVITNTAKQWALDLLNGFNKTKQWAMELGQWIARPFVAYFTAAWGLVKKGWNDLKDALKYTYDHGIKPIWDIFSKGIKAVQTDFENAKNGIAKAWDGIKKAAEVPVSFVVNTVLDKGIIPAINKVGGIFPGFHAIQPIRTPFSTGSWVPGHAPSDHSDNVDSSLTPQEFIVKRRSALSIEKMFPGLLEAMNAFGPTALMHGRAHFAGGGWTDKILTAANPVNLIKDSVNALINRTPGSPSAITDMARGAGSKMLSDTVSWITSKINPLTLGGKVGTSIKNALNPTGGSGVSRWAPQILQALKMLGQPASLLGAVEQRMNRESGGNPNAINNWDSNAKAGDPSRGLMQTIGSTFAAYAGPYRNMSIYNPMANIYAALNYALHAYGSVSRAMYQPGGYAAGILKSVPGFRWIGEHGPELEKLPGGSTILNAGRSAQIARTGSNNPPAAGGGDNEVLTVLRQVAKLLAAQPSRDDQAALLDTLGKLTNGAVKAATTTVRAHA